MTNYRSDKETDLEIAIDKISVISKKYRIKPLVASNLSQNNTDSIGGHQISWQEQAVMHFIISPLESIGSHCTTTECSLSTTKGGTYSDMRSSVADFICLEHAHDQFTASLEAHKKELAKIEAELEKENQGPRSIAEIRRARSNVSSSNTNTSSDTYPIKMQNRDDSLPFHPTSRAFLCSPHQHSRGSEINVVCSWKTKGLSVGEIIEGQHHLRQLVVRPQHKSKSCPLLIGAKYNSSLQHDFSLGPVNLDMDISIRNRLFHSSVDFDFSLQSRRDLEFVGPERFNKVLKAGEEVAFPLTAVLFESGMHNLQCVKLIVNNSDGSKTPFIFPLQWIVHVNN